MEKNRLLALAALLAAFTAAGTMAAYGASERGLGLALRTTARIGLAWFVLAFVASSVNRLWRNDGTKWLLRNRKYLGLGFAILHFTHAGFIAARVAVHSDNFWSARTAGSLVPGTVAYLFLAAMTVTSFEGPRRALGRTPWLALHKTGMYVLWAVFTGAYAKGLSNHPANAIGVGLLGGALALRLAARLTIIRKRRAHPTASTAA